MQLLGRHEILGGELIPFDTTLTNLAPAGPAYSIVYDTSTKRFHIPYASTNDYYISWQVALRTASVSQYPIFSLELSYNDTTRSDLIIIPMRTTEVINSSIFHVEQISSSDILSIGLKVIGTPPATYTLYSDSTANIAAAINILGL